MQIRAAVLEDFGAPLQVQVLELAEPRAGEALVRLEACGVCHTDLYTASGADRPRAPTPPGTRRRCSATRAPASWSASAKASATSDPATT
jgi:hypothetical protein